jgi:hypothetical protein
MAVDFEFDHSYSIVRYQNVGQRKTVAQPTFLIGNTFVLFLLSDLTLGGHRNYKTTSLKEKNMQTAKQAAKQIIDHVSDQATWDDIMYELYVKQKIEKGLSAIEEGRVLSNEDAKKRLLGNEG